MADKIRPPYHIGEQSAAALLPPIVATLGELDARLTQYVERLHLSDHDRARLAEAEQVVARARASVDSILAGSQGRKE